MIIANWTIFTAIFTAITAIATFFAAGVALWIACTEQSRQDSHKKKVIKSQKCDLILIPTKEWDSGANYQKLIGELTGMNRLNEAALYAKKHHTFPVEDPAIEMVSRQARFEYDHSISKKYFLEGSMVLFSNSEFPWIDSERIYGVNVKTNIAVSKVKQSLVVTQYFKDAFITSQGEKHDKTIKKIKK